MKTIKELPFFYKAQENPGNGHFPETLLFDLFYDEKLELFRQKSTAVLDKLLEKVYLEGSLVEGSLSSESGSVYLESVVRYLIQKSSIDPDTTILEIGFGSGILLRKLKELGFENLTGVEPGQHRLVEGLENIKLISDFFPSKALTQKYKLIYSFGILEHIADPISFMKAQMEYLEPDGKIIFSVPNCTPYLKVGDPSIFIHEHYSYFTEESIFNLAKQVELLLEDISVIEGAYIVTLSKGKNAFQVERNSPLLESEFDTKLQLQMNKLSNLLNKFNRPNISVYTPIRAMNILYLLGAQDVRLVDDNSEMHGKYLPYLKSHIESFNEICQNPPECIIIFSRTFGDRIKTKCRSEKSLDQTMILTLDEIDLMN